MSALSAAAQWCSAAWATLACGHLEWLLKIQTLWKSESRTNEISFSLRIISLAGSKSYFVQGFFCSPCFGMHGESHALSAWMNGKCWNNCFTLFSGVSGWILSCEFHWGVTYNASLFLFPSLSQTLLFVQRMKSTAVNAHKVFAHYQANTSNPQTLQVRAKTWRESLSLYFGKCIHGILLQLFTV